MILNLTPHAVNVIREDNTTLTIAPSGTVARVSQMREQIGEVEGIPINVSKFGEVVDLPEQQEGVFLIVSRLVISALPDREDLIVPDDLVRDDQGRIIGCRSFSR